jgi:hypothetical protein
MHLDPKPPSPPRVPLADRELLVPAELHPAVAHLVPLPDRGTADAVDDDSWVEAVNAEDIPNFLGMAAGKTTEVAHMLIHRADTKTVVVAAVEGSVVEGAMTHPMVVGVAVAIALRVVVVEVLQVVRTPVAAATTREQHLLRQHLFAVLEVAAVWSHWSRPIQP